MLYIHDHSRVVISKHDKECKIGLGRGVRQGCGLSPLLWLCYTLLLHDELEKVLPLESQTSYADDFHVMWDYRTALCNRGFISRVTDDATPVQEATRSDHETVRRNSYLFFLKKA